MSKKIVAIVGSYRKGGTVDRMVEAVLDVAREKGAETHTVYLTEQRIEFCTNCRQCTQTPGVERGKCAQQDGMEAILQEIEAADAVVLGSPVNYYNVTAIFRRFMERPRKAVLVASAGMPGFLIPIATGAPRALRLAAKMLGARPVDSLWIGLASGVEHPPISARNQQRARRMGMRLAY
jgi:hypothetical protein